MSDPERNSRPACLRAALAAACALVGGACGEVAARERPNVVLVVIDTLRPDHLGAYGYSRAISPHLDALAADSVVFESAQTTAPWTAPALVSLMTSLQPSVHQVRTSPNPERLAEGATTLAEVLRDAGYATVAFTGGGYARGEFGLDRGFEHYGTGGGEGNPDPELDLRASRLRPNLDAACAWLGEPRSQPFFLFFHTYEVHWPYSAPEEYVRRVRPQWDEAQEHGRLREVVERWNAAREIDADGALLLRNHHQHCGLGGAPPLEAQGELRERIPEVAGSGELPEQTVELVRDLYDAEILYVDHELARLWRRLDELALAENTIVVVTSDHGEALGEHGRIGHGSVLHEELLRVVLMVRSPAHTPRRVRELVSLVDVMPTVLELTKVRPPASAALQGRSLVGSMRGEVWPAPLAHASGLNVPDHAESWHSLRSGRWRFVTDQSSDSSWLYDRAADPGEERDVSALRPEVLARMHALLEERLERDRELSEGLGETQPVAFEEDLLRELRRLGYVEGAQ